MMAVTVLLIEQAGSFPTLNPKSRQNKQDVDMISFSEGLSAIVVYVHANIAVFFLYAYDKHLARTDAWRTSEHTLIAAALVGPFGAYGAMRLFRHKTKKMRFNLVPVFMIIHIAGMLYVAAILLHHPL